MAKTCKVQHSTIPVKDRCHSTFGFSSFLDANELFEMFLSCFCLIVLTHKYAEEK